MPSINVLPNELYGPSKFRILISMIFDDICQLYLNPGSGTQDSTEQPTSQNTTQYSTSQNATKSSQTATQPSTSQNATQSSASQNATQTVIPQNETKPLTSQDAPVKQSSQNAAVIANTRVSLPQAPATAPSVNTPSTSAASNSGKINVRRVNFEAAYVGNKAVIGSTDNQINEFKSCFGGSLNNLM